MKSKPDMVKVAEASCVYDEEKPGKNQRITLAMIGRRYGVTLNQLWNFRRVYEQTKSKKPGAG